MRALHLPLVGAHLAALVLLSSLLHAQPPADYYVSPSGRDDWSGRLAVPAPGGKDGPFATIARAQRAARESKSGRSVNIQLRAGTYYLTQPLTFNDQDSGTPDHPITYSAYPNETPVLSGGVRLKGWHLDKSRRWQTAIPEVARGEWTFAQLFVNGQRRYRPRLPRRGYFHIAQRVRAASAKDRVADRFIYSPGDLDPKWQGTDAEVLVYHDSAMSRLRIASIDEATRVVTFTGGAFHDSHEMRRGDRYIVENIPEALEVPGEWYLDRRLGIITYVPRDGEEMDSIEIVAPRLERLMIINGAQNIRFQGITFAHTNWTAPPAGYSYAQSDIAMPAAIETINARRLEFTRCRIRGTAGYAIAFGAGSRYNRLEYSDLSDLGAGGVKIGEISAAMLRNEEAEPTRGEEAAAANNIIRENNIEGGGRVQPAGAGVWIGHSPNNEVLNNRIHDFFHTGISVGWTWGYRSSLAHHNRIEDNDVFRIGEGVLNDIGGIYTLGVSTGTAIRHNLIHDVQAYSSGGRGIYLDEGSSGILVEDNIVYNTSHEAFFLDYGRDNDVVNNIFALSRNDLIGSHRHTDGMSLRFERNILYWTQGRFTREPLQSQNRIEHNLLWNPNGSATAFGDDSVIADPLFINPDNGDFRLKEGSPALQIGFKPIPPEGMGLSRPTRREKNP